MTVSITSKPKIEKVIEPDSLVEGTLRTGFTTRRVIYSRKSGKYHALNGETPADDARVWEAVRREDSGG